MFRCLLIFKDQAKIKPLEFNLKRTQSVYLNKVMRSRKKLFFLDQPCRSEAPPLRDLRRFRAEDLKVLPRKRAPVKGFSYPWFFFFGTVRISIEIRTANSPVKTVTGLVSQQE